MSAYLMGGQRLTPHDASFADALAAAHVERHRPLCLCLTEGVAMYVARVRAGFIVKRMPGTGSLHAPDCLSYVPPAEFSGLAHVVGSAITESPETGITSLKLGFAMSKIGTSSIRLRCDDHVHTEIDSGAKLTLGCLLHYLWDQAELTRWHPGFAGRRSWATVRRHLYSATEGKIARGWALPARLYIPEVFNVQRRDEITTRRAIHWARARPRPRVGGVRQLMLLIGELKKIMPARFGYRAMIKHVPDQAFALSDQLSESMGRQFVHELSLWETSNDLHMVMIATFGLNDVGIPTIEELSFMPTRAQWIPVEDAFEVQLLDRLLKDGRRFTKCLQYGVPTERDLPSVVLLDTANRRSSMRISRPGSHSVWPHTQAEDAASGWIWLTGKAMPPLPMRVPARPS